MYHIVEFIGFQVVDLVDVLRREICQRYGSEYYKFKCYRLHMPKYKLNDNSAV